MLTGGVTVSAEEEKGAGEGAVVAGLACVGEAWHRLCCLLGRMSGSAHEEERRREGRVSLGWPRPVAGEGAGRSAG